MLPDELERVADRHVPGAGKLDIQRLSHGLVNDTYRVRRGAATYAMRVAACNPPDLGLDRAWEARVLERAAAAGLAPAVEYCDPQRGILISRWAVGRQWHSRGRAAALGNLADRRAGAAHPRAADAGAGAADECRDVDRLLHGSGSAEPRSGFANCRGIANRRRPSSGGTAKRRRPWSATATCTP